jgi:hypothetical protein
MMAWATNAGTIKGKEKREKAPSPLLQMLLSMEEWRQVIQAPYIGFKHTPPMRQMMCEPVPRQLFQKLNLHGTQMKQKAETIYTDIERF